MTSCRAADCTGDEWRQVMKRIVSPLANAILMLGLGVASVYAQHVPLTLSFSGTAVSSTINLQAGAAASEYNIVGSGTLGPFTFRGLEASSVPPGSCPATNHPYAGAGVFRFDDGSLLMVNLTQGSCSATRSPPRRGQCCGQSGKALPALPGACYVLGQ